MYFSLFTAKILHKCSNGKNMPIDYQQIFVQIKEIGKNAKERRKKKEDAQASARELLAFYSSELDLLRSKVDLAKLADSNTRCALQAKHPKFSPTPNCSTAMTFCQTAFPCLTDWWH